MHKRNRSIQEKIDDCLDTKIKNLHPEFRKELHQFLTDNPKIANSVAGSAAFIVQKYGFKPMGVHTTQYWLSRGWSEDESRYYSNLNSKKGQISSFSQEFWLAKINPVTAVNFTIIEADFQRNSQRPIRKEYWMKLGHSEEESISLAQNTKTSNNLNGAKSNGSRNKSSLQSSSPRCVEYWLLREYSEEDAKNKVAEYQTTFSLEKCIKKYGIEIGQEKWQERQDKWQNTLDSKSDEEKLRINSLKLYRGGTISKVELEILTKLSMLGLNVIHQFKLQKDKTRHFVYDFTFGQKIIEFNGDYWHANPSKFKEDSIMIRGKLAKEIWVKDKEKIDFAKSLGYEILVIWESEYKQYKQQTINKCLNFLTQ